MKRSIIISYLFVFIIICSFILLRIYQNYRNPLYIINNNKVLKKAFIGKDTSFIKIGINATTNFNNQIDNVSHLQEYKLYKDSTTREKLFFDLYYYNKLSDIYYLFSTPQTNVFNSSKNVNLLAEVKLLSHNPVFIRYYGYMDSKYLYLDSITGIDSLLLRISNQSFANEDFNQK